MKEYFNFNNAINSQLFLGALTLTSDNCRTLWLFDYYDYGYILCVLYYILSLSTEIDE